MEVASTVHLVLFGYGTHSKGNTDTAHLTLGFPTHKSLNVGKIHQCDAITTYQKPGKGEEDLIKTDMMLKDFEGKASPARGAINVELTIRSKILATTFFIINSKGSNNFLLGQDWIHANCCIPSTMHHCLIQLLEDTVAIIYADSSLNVAIVNPQVSWYDGMSCISIKV
jgi:hypothetical protein